MANAISVQTKNYLNGTLNNDWAPITNGRSLHVGYTGQNWVMVIMFTLPAAASAVQFKWNQADSGYNSDDYRIRYDLLDAESSAYNNIQPTTAGQGYFAGNGGSLSVCSFSIAGNRAAGTYYLYLWGYSTNTADWANIRSYSDASYGMVVSYTEIVGAAKIYNVSAWATAIPKIWDGGQWRQAMPKIWDGSEWRTSG